MCLLMNEPRQRSTCGAATNFATAGKSLLQTFLTTSSFLIPYDVSTGFIAAWHTGSLRSAQDGEPIVFTKTCSQGYPATVHAESHQGRYPWPRSANSCWARWSFYLALRR
jgi:hypothetical protein